MEPDDINGATWMGDHYHLAAVQIAINRAQAGEVDYLAGWLHDEIVAAGGIDYTRTPNTGVLWQLNVREDLRSQGIGTALVNALENCAKNRGFKQVALSVENNNPRAQQLYERLGYVVTGESTESWDVAGPDGSSETYVAQCFVMERQLH